VTRIGDFFKISFLVFVDKFFEQLFPAKKLSINFDPKVVGLILGDFFPNSSDHSGWNSQLVM
jgi:hypothetical protein